MINSRIGLVGLSAALAISAGAMADFGRAMNIAANTRGVPFSRIRTNGTSSRGWSVAHDRRQAKKRRNVARNRRAQR
jgi:hypothetical protein